MGNHKAVFPGVVTPLHGYHGWNKGQEKRSIAQKREVLIRGIERSLRRDKGAPRLEHFDHAQGAPVIRVLYASHPLPIFAGETAALIDPHCDRGQLWGAIIDQIRAGTYDAEIEEVAQRVSRSIRRPNPLTAA
jgi:hypothetical protein